MPHSTMKGPADLAMLMACGGYAHAIGARFAAGRGPAYLVELGTAGLPIRVDIGPGHSLRERLEALQRESRAHLFYDPFEGAEHTWVSWNDLSPAFLDVLRDGTEGLPDLCWPPGSSGSFMS